MAHKPAKQQNQAQKTT